MSKKSFLGKSIVSIRDLTKEDLDTILVEAEKWSPLFNLENDL